MAAVWGKALARGRAVALLAADRAGVVARSVPGAAGALALAWGMGQVYRPLFWITVGVFLLAVDRRMP